MSSGPTKHGTVRCPHCQHDTGHMPGKPAIAVICGWCRAVVLIPGEAPDTPSAPLDAFSAAADHAGRSIAAMIQALAQIPAASPAAALHPVNCPGDHRIDGEGNIVDCYLDPDLPPTRVAAAPKLPEPDQPTTRRRPTRELLFDDDGWEDWQ